MKKILFLFILSFQIFAQENCFDLLKKFYPDQSSEFIKQRIQLTKNDPHLFLRSFPPLFYYYLKDSKEFTKFFGVMGGDSHMENFGIRISQDQFRFVYNDFDDLVPGPIFEDVLRLMTSAKLAGAEFKIDKLLSHYLNGIEGKKHEYSDYVKGLFKDSINAPSLDPKAVDTANAKFLKKKEPNYPVEDAVLTKWQEVLKVTIKDAYLYHKPTGGSAGLDRFQFLIEDATGNLVWIEAKEMQNPSFNVANQIPSPTPLDRFKLVNLYLPAGWTNVVTLNQKNFYLRLVTAKQKGVTIADVKPHQLTDVLYDEAFAKGQFHQTFLNNISEYKSYVKSLDTRDLEKKVKWLEELFRSQVTQ